MKHNYQKVIFNSNNICLHKNCDRYRCSKIVIDVFLPQFQCLHAWFLFILLYMLVSSYSLFHKANSSVPP